MTPIRIDGPADPRIAAYHNLSDSELLRQRGLFIAEGRLVLQRVVEDARFSLRSLLMNEANYRALSETLSGVSPEVPLFVCETPDFLGITGFNLHRGCLALVERPAAIAPCQILRDARTIVVLEGVANADNVGGVFRNVCRLWRGRRAAEPDLLRSVLPEGDSHIDGCDPSRPLREDRRLAERSCRRASYGFHVGRPQPTPDIGLARRVR